MGSSIDAEARPVRRPPSSCLSAWVAPCMRRFNSLMSNLPVGITHSPFYNTLVEARAAVARRYRLAGNDSSMAGSAQDRADRTGLGDREHDDRQRRLAGKRECGRIHHLVAALDGLGVGQAVEPLRGRVFFGIGTVDAVDIG